MNILMVGCGKMGGAMLRRWIAETENSFTVVDPVAQGVPDGAEHLKDRAELGERTFDMIVVAIKPQMIDDVLPDFRDYLKDGGCLVSIAAGYSLEAFERVFGPCAMVRIMPNLPAMIGKGVNGAFGNDQTSREQREAVDTLVSATGTVQWVDDEDSIDRITAVSGSGPGYVFEIVRSYVEAAKSLGFSNEEARSLVFQTMAGTVEMAAGSDLDLEELRNSVTSKNGTTEAGLNQLMRDGVLDGLLGGTVLAAYERAVELR